MKKVNTLILFVVFLVANSFAQSAKIPLIGSKAPSFTAPSTNGTLTFPDDYGKSWKILFSHPQDFTPVCTSELLELAYMQKDFNKLGVKIAIVSTDDVKQHELWKASLEEINYKGRGNQKISFPIIDDHLATVSKQYGMLHAPESTNKDVRGVFIIDGKNIVRSINFYPMQVGRNMAEIERILVALKTADNEMVCTPANWNLGDDVIVPHYPYTDAELAANPSIKDDY